MFGMKTYTFGMRRDINGVGQKVEMGNGTEFILCMSKESERATRLGSFDINIVVYCTEQATMKLLCLSMHQTHISLIDEPNQTE